MTGKSCAGGGGGVESCRGCFCHPTRQPTGTAAGSDGGGGDPFPEAKLGKA